MDVQPGTHVAHRTKRRRIPPRRAQAATALLSALLLLLSAPASAGPKPPTGPADGGVADAGSVTSTAAAACVDYYRDADGDGHGKGSRLGSTCTGEEPDGTALDNTDCNDANPSVYTSGSYYRDADGDGRGAPGVLATCGPLAGYVTNGTDCNDANATVYASGSYYRDADADSYGNPSVFANCGPLTGYVTNALDCDDTSALYRPGATLTCGTGECRRTVQSCDGTMKRTCQPALPTAETCDHKDNNCDEMTDNVVTPCGTGACRREALGCREDCYPDGQGVQSCTYEANACSPGLPTAETCDAVDNDCDGHVDNHPGVLQPHTLWKPCDNPYGCNVVGQQVCAAGGSWSVCSGCGGTAPCKTAECNESSRITCNTACVPTGVCQPVEEVCNDCDDDLDGVEDEALSCQPGDF